MKSKGQYVAWAMTLAIMAMSFTGCNNDTENDISSSETVDSIVSTTTQVKTTEQQIKKTTSIESETTSNIKNSFLSEYDDDDFTEQYNNFDAEITLNGDKASVNGDTDNVSINGALITISKGGVYRLSGTLSNGQVNVTGSEKVKLYLDGADITFNDGPAIYCNNEKRTIITLADGTENHLADGTGYVVSSYAENFDPAALYAEDKLTINGTGSLTIDGNYANGIVSRNDLKITDGIVSVTALNNGIKGKDSVAFCGGTISISAGNDGIKATEADDPDKGWVEIDGGNISVEAVGDGIQAETDLYIFDGTLNIKTTGEITVDNENDMFSNGGFGDFNGGMGHGKFENRNHEDMEVPNQTNQQPIKTETNTSTLSNIQLITDKTDSSGETTQSEQDASSKGIKASNIMQISGGNINIESTDHAVHSGGEMKISNGILQLSSLYSKGISSHGNMTISGDTTEIVIANATEGIESKAILQINSGNIRILNATDDGINTGGGNTFMGGLGMNNSQNEADTSDSNNSHELLISGGTIFVSAEGDGIDSNGSISITGGTVIVSGPVSGADGSFDSETGITITGGNVMALSSRGMMEYPNEGCMVSTSINASANDLISVIDSNGNVLTAFQTKKAVSDIIYFYADTDLSSCQLNIGGKYNGTLNEDGYATSGNVTGGNVCEWSDSSNVSMPNGMQGGGGHGMRPNDGERPSFKQMPNDEIEPPDGDNGINFPNENNKIEPPSI